MGTENLMVSVCITAYNHEEYIDQAIESVLTQQVDFDYEILIGEDDSSDSTRSIVKKYQEKFPEKIRLFLNSRENVIYVNGRATGTWNFINNFRNAKGKYIALLDGDDYWICADKLQKQVDVLEAHPDCSICFHNAEFLREDGSTQPFMSTLGLQPKTRYTLEDILYRNFMPTGAVVFRNRFLTEFPEQIYKVFAGDWFLHTMNAQHGDIIYIDEIMSCYRIHGEGAWSALGRKERMEENIRMSGLIDEFLNHKYTELIQNRISYFNAQINEIVNCCDNVERNHPVSKESGNTSFHGHGWYRTLWMRDRKSVV